MIRPAAKIDTDSLDLLYVPDEQAPASLRLEDIILRRKLVDEKQLDAARKVVAESPGKSVGQALIETGALSETDLMSCVAEQSGMPFERLTRASVADDALRSLPLEFARKNVLLPLRIESGHADHRHRRSGEHIRAGRRSQEGRAAYRPYRLHRHRHPQGA